MIPILVTGGAKGLGAAICRCLAQKGHDLVIHYKKSEQDARDLAQECRQHHVLVETIQGDFCTVTSVESFIERYHDRFPHTKGLVNNVGNYLIASACATTHAQWLSLFQTNFFAPVFLTQSLVPALREQK